MCQPCSVKKLMIRSNTVERLNNVDEDNKNLSQVVNIVQNELNVKISGNHIDKSHPIKKNKENRYIVKFTKHSMAETI